MKAKLSYFSERSHIITEEQTFLLNFRQQKYPYLSYKNPCKPTFSESLSYNLSYESKLVSYWVGPQKLNQIQIKDFRVLF